MDLGRDLEAVVFRPVAVLQVLLFCWSLVWSSVRGGGGWSLNLRRDMIGFFCAGMI